jgi:hypothetical protein
MGFEVPAGASPITGGADSLRRFVAPVLLRVKDTDGSLQGCYLAGRQFSSEDFCDAIGEKMENGQCRVRSTMPIDCAAGTVPTAIVNGVVRCDPIGSSENCPVGSALVAVGVGESVCQKF